MKPPEVFILSGPNGAGKTTSAGLLLPKRLGLTEFVNADLIARGISPYSPDTSAFEAGRIMLRRIRDLKQQRKSFAFETTLASRTFAPFLSTAKDEGYLVHIIFVWLSSPQLAVDRVKARVARGGHNVPEETVRRRYVRGLRNFFDLYEPLANTWLVCDNSGSEPVQVARGKAGHEPMIHEQETFARIRQGTDG